jgi:hypothetical protein
LLCAAPGFGTTDVRVEDQLNILAVDRRLISVNSVSGAIIETELETGEEVVRIESQGLVGVVATNLRLLGTTAGSVRFKPLRYRIEEREGLPALVHVADRVVLVALSQRVVALAATSAGWSQLSLGPRETVERAEADANLAVFATDRRAVAFSPESGGFVAVALTPEEDIESLSVEGSSVTLQTPYRVLVFRAGLPVWTELIRRERR